ncbi:hypothetical protein CSUI_001412 [Cystoisospora suis]|uniref:Uncharacterized protein n=1 Tax=Cystoisospora suis TaxID=483139 RepID=A0A2C6LCQ6_9APIC|nr:hypothetical protein CSUI_001412 [Cystoisospora suis]
MESKTLCALIRPRSLISARHLSNPRPQILPGILHGFDQKGSAPAHLLENSQFVSYAVMLSRCSQISSFLPHRRSSQSRGFSSVLTSRCTSLTEKKKDRSNQTRRHHNKRGQHAADHHTGEANPEYDDALPRVVRKAVEASLSSSPRPLCFWQAHAEQAIRILPSLIPPHLGLLMRAYARAGVRHPPLAAGVTQQFVQLLQRQRQHPLIFMQDRLGGEVAGDTTATPGNRERVDFGALSILLLALEKLHLLSHPLVCVPAQQLQDVLVQRLQGSCDTFNFQQLKRLMLLLAKLAAARVPAPAVRTLEADEVEGGNRLAGVRGASARGSERRRNTEGRQDRLPYDLLEKHPVALTRSFLIEVMRATSERAAAATCPAARAKESFCDEREMFAVSWCISKFDRMIFGSDTVKERRRSCDALIVHGEDGGAVRTNDGRGMHGRDSVLVASDAEGDLLESEDGYSYQDLTRDSRTSSDELTDEMVELYVDSRERLLDCATRGVRTTIVSRLRCAPLDAAMALDAYLRFSDAYMSSKLEHYLSFLLSAASLHELVLFADGLKHLLIANRRIWELWVLHVEDAIEAAPCDSVHKVTENERRKLLKRQDLRNVAQWFRALGKFSAVLEASLGEKGGEARAPSNEFCGGEEGAAVEVYR